jgi:SRSO17 transposase
MTKVVEGKYQSGHHFLADSPWDADMVNIRRLALWQEDDMTRMEKDGWFIQDDTGQERRIRGKEKPEGGKRLKGGTDGVARQYIGNVGKVSEGMVFVSSHYADGHKRIPIVADLYWPRNAMEKLPEVERTDRRKRDKIKIALDQLKWVKEEENVSSPKPEGVVADNWYGSSPRYLNTIHKKLKWKYVVGIRPNRKLFIRLLREVCLSIMQKR